MTQTGEAKTATLYTPESANRALSYVRVVVADLVDACARLQRAEEARARASSGASTRDRDDVLRKAEDDRRSARADRDRTLRELETAGVEVKDPATGLVDFPGELEGRRVYLCWKHGEERVAFWHDLEDGFRGRRPLASGVPGAVVPGPATGTASEKAPPPRSLDGGESL